MWVNSIEQWFPKFTQLSPLNLANILSCPLLIFLLKTSFTIFYFQILFRPLYFLCVYKIAFSFLDFQTQLISCSYQLINKSIYHGFTNARNETKDLWYFTVLNDSVSFHNIPRISRASLKVLVAPSPQGPAQTLKTSGKTSVTCEVEIVWLKNPK
jgi:hypothetical protein